MNNRSTSLRLAALVLGVAGFGPAACTQAANSRTVDGRATSAPGAAGGSRSANPDSADEPPGAYPVTDTAQDRCWDNDAEVACEGLTGAFSGQDGQYQGTANHFVDNGDGTVTDLATGLMWQQDLGEKVSFDQAVAGASGFDLAGYDDWRLPTIKELYSLMDFSGVTGMSANTSVPFVNTLFFEFRYGDEGAGERFIDSQYATSTQYTSTTMMGSHTMFGVNFADGRIKGYGTTGPHGDAKSFEVRYVRGAAGYGDNDFADRGDGTVEDLTTGLTWQQADDGVGRNWEQALEYCEGLSLGGHDDWRLPNAKELQGLVDYGRSPDTTASAAIDPVFDTTSIVDDSGEVDWPFFWTSTTHLDGPVPAAFAVYAAFGECEGWMEAPPGTGATLMDVHGAGCQRSDPKAGDPADYPTGHGPQGDVVRVYNHARCTRGGAVFATVDAVSEATPDTTGGGPTDPAGPTDPTDPTDPIGPVACTAEADCSAAGSCPPDALMGCTCMASPEGAKQCVPACEIDTDCPEPPDLTLVCTQGICTPEGAGGPGSGGGPPPR